MGKLGVLIVGSLYWDLKAPRPRWRAERLDCPHQEQVKVPIRYRRRSTSRGEFLHYGLLDGTESQRIWYRDRGPIPFLQSR